MHDLAQPPKTQSKMIVFKFADCPKEKWGKGFQCALSFPGVDTASGIVPNFFAVKGKNIDEEKLLRKLTKILNRRQLYSSMQSVPKKNGGKDSSVWFVSQELKLHVVLSYQTILQ
ncbi:PREDICTED: uncharacterized protein LOC104761276 isoform X2 [Camelina sativa]|uniref:Uncharacterized protein LOC104761276 isoform X2 n=1 Tax=Camelina sativa TaxID=90675 RepID=A0ABM0X9E6_CAMSA|nr:PREDICTED: uncharacterized protein LOC104761276 isoform X2 [Camelina sativa]